jgi:hypothetical protein
MCMTPNTANLQWHEELTEAWPAVFCVCFQTKDRESIQSQTSTPDFMLDCCIPLSCCIPSSCSWVSVKYFQGRPSWLDGQKLAYVQESWKWQQKTSLHIVHSISKGMQKGSRDMILNDERRCNFFKIRLCNHSAKSLCSIMTNTGRQTPSTACQSRCLLLQFIWPGNARCSCPKTNLIEAVLHR